MQVTPRRDTPCELALRRAAHRLGLRFRVDRPIVGSRRRADLVFARARIAVFVDGCFWHGCPVHGTWPKANAAWWRDKIRANMQRDRDTDAELVAAGWRVLRFWEHEDAALAAAKIARIIRQRPRAGGQLSVLFAARCRE
jgi:DNA mismatch endonuclease (patch repair protein)